MTALTRVVRDMLDGRENDEQITVEVSLLWSLIHEAERIDPDRLARALLDSYGAPAVDGYGVAGRCMACGEDGVWSDDVDRRVHVIVERYEEGG